VDEHKLTLATPENPRQQFDFTIYDSGPRPMSMRMVGGPLPGPEVMLSGAVPTNASPFDQLKDGSHTLRLTIHLVFTDHPRGFQSDRPKTTTDVIVEVPFTLLPSNQPSVQSINDAKTRSSIEKGLHLNAYNDWQGYVVPVDQFSPPVPISYDVIVRTNGTEKTIGSFNSIPSSVSQTEFHVRGPVLRHADVLLRSNPTPVVETLDVTQMADIPLEFHDLPNENSRGPMDATWDAVKWLMGK
jgi:hypothetical protein